MNTHALLAGQVNEDFEKATEYYEQYAGTLESKKDKAKAYHNLGNVFLKRFSGSSQNQNPEEQKKSSDYLKNSIEAYKNSLRNNPNDEDTRYNLSYALSKLKQQQQQENKDQKEDKNEDEKKDGDKKEENKDKEKIKQLQAKLDKYEQHTVATTGTQGGSTQNTPGQCNFGNKCWRKDCKFQHPEGFTPAPNPRDRTCEECGRKGHSRAECGRCFKCGGKSHRANECRSTVKRDQGAQEVRAEERPVMLRIK